MATADKEIVVVCPICKTFTKLDGLGAWSFIILKRFYCEKCKQLVKEKEVEKHD